MRRIWSRIFLVVLCLALLAGNVFAGETTLILRFRPIESGVCAIDSIYGVSANYQNGATIYCSELITRFYQTLYGVDVLVGDGPIVTGDDADTYWFEPTTSPVAGDVAYAAPAKRGKGYPHYALVKYANAKAGTVTLMEQNWSWNGGAAYERTIPYSGDCYVFYSLRCASGKAKMNVPEADTVSPWAKSAVQRADNLTESAEELHARGAQFSTTARQELAVLQDALHEIMGYAADAFTTRQARVARHIEPVEEVIDDLVETLRARHTRRLLDGKCTVYGGLGFLNSLTNIERIADQCSNLGIYTIALTDPDIARTHHDYI